MEPQTTTIQQTAPAAAEPPPVDIKEIPAPRKGQKRAKVLSVTSVKGGVGKTTITANLGVLLSRFGLKCLVIDGDLKLPSVGFHLNVVEPEVTLVDYLRGRFTIEQAVQTHESGLKVIAGSISELYAPTDRMKEGIEKLAPQYDWIIIDTPASLDENLRNMIASSNEVLIVSSLDLPAISGSLKAAKLAMELNVPIKGVILNKVQGKDYELGIKEIEEILRLPVIASIPEDSMVTESLSKKTTVIEYSNRSAASKELKKLAILLTGTEPRKNFFSTLFDGIKALFGK